MPAERGARAGDPRQQTLAQEVTFSGIGLHSGASVRCTVEPAPADHGLVFYSRGVRIPACLESAVDSTRCSALRVGDTQIATVEHLLAALAGLRIDNARILVEGPEIPALDGSALPFAEGLMAAGIHEQNARARVIRLPSAEWISDGDRHVVAVPAEGLTVATAVDYGRPLAGAQIFSFSFDATPKPAAAILALAGATMGSEWGFVMPEPVQGTAPAATGARRCRSFRSWRRRAPSVSTTGLRRSAPPAWGWAAPSRTRC